MKISSITLGATLLGLVHFLGPWTAHPFQLEHGNNAAVAGQWGSGKSETFFASTLVVHEEESQELNRIKRQEAEFSRRIKDAENTLRTLSANEQDVRQRLAHLKSRARVDRYRGSRLDSERLAAEASEKALLKHLQALEEEKGAYVCLLEELRNKHTTLRISIDLFGVKAKRYDLERGLHGTENGPLDDLGKGRHFLSQAR